MSTNRANRMRERDNLNIRILSNLYCVPYHIHGGHLTLTSMSTISTELGYFYLVRVSGSHFLILFFKWVRERLETKFINTFTFIPDQKSWLVVTWVVRKGPKLLTSTKNDYTLSYMVLRNTIHGRYLGWYRFHNSINCIYIS